MNPNTPRRAGLGRPSRRELLRAGVAGGLGLALGPAMLPLARAQTAAPFPSKPISLIVTATPGGEADATARLLADALRAQLNTPVVVENKPGAGVGVGAGHVARSAPDGYTLLLGGSGLTASPAVMKAAHDPVREFTPISQVMSLDFFIFVRSDSPIRTLADLVQLGRKGELNYGSSGNGTITHFQMELLKSMARFDATHIPYKGTAPALTALVGGDIQALFAGTPALPLVQAGRLRMIAAVTPTRSRDYPQVPTIEESYPGYNAIGWSGVLGPAGLPPAVVERLNAATIAAVADPTFVAKIRAMGGQAGGSTPQAMGERLKSETARFTALGAAAGIVPQ